MGERLLEIGGQRGAGQAAPRPAVPVVVATAVRSDVPVQIRAIARVEAYSTVTVKPQVAGQLMAVHFQEGQDVKAGDLLFSLDPRPFQAALAQAEGTLAHDTAMAKDAAAEAAREADLYQQKVATQREYDQSQASAAATAATVQADQAAVEQARLDLEYCSIRSPFDGRTGAVLVYPGNVVKANEAALVVVNQISPIYVTFSVPEQHLAQIVKYRAAGTAAGGGQHPAGRGSARARATDVHRQPGGQHDRDDLAQGDVCERAAAALAGAVRQRGPDADHRIRGGRRAESGRAERPVRPVRFRGQGGPDGRDAARRQWAWRWAAAR